MYSITTTSHLMGYSAHHKLQYNKKLTLLLDLELPCSPLQRVSHGIKFLRDFLTLISLPLYFQKKSSDIQ